MKTKLEKQKNGFALNLSWKFALKALVSVALSFSFGWTTRSAHYEQTLLPTQTDLFRVRDTVHVVSGLPHGEAGPETVFVQAAAETSYIVQFMDIPPTVDTVRVVHRSTYVDTVDLVNRITVLDTVQIETPAPVPPPTWRTDPRRPGE
jgi:hypothetical protein